MLRSRPHPRFEELFRFPRACSGTYLNSPGDGSDRWSDSDTHQFRSARVRWVPVLRSVLIRVTLADLPVALSCLRFNVGICVRETRRSLP